MEKQDITVEDIERRQRLLSVLFKVFVAILILIGCVFVGWLISFIGYAHDFQNIGMTGIAPIFADSLTDIGRAAATIIV